MAGFGFFGGGLAQGLNQGASNARDMAIQGAYLKLQQQQQALNNQMHQDAQSRYDATEANAPFMKLLDIAPKEAGLAIDANNANAFHRPIPSSSFPTHTPGMNPDAAESGEFSPPTSDLTAIRQGAYNAADMLRKTQQSRATSLEASTEARARAQDEASRANIAHQSAMLEHLGTVDTETARHHDAMERAALQKPSIADFHKLRSQIANSIATKGMTLPPGETVDSLTMKLFSSGMGVDPSAPAEAPGAVPAASGPTGFTPGGSPAPQGLAPAPQNLSLGRPASPSQQKRLEDIDGIVSAIGSVAQLAKNPPAGATIFGHQFPATGMGMGPLTTVESQLPESWVRGIGDDPDKVAERATYHGALAQAQLQQLKTIIGGRITGYEIAYSRATGIAPGPEKSPELNARILNKMYALAKNTRDIIANHMKQNGYTSIDQIKDPIFISPENLLGEKGPATSATATLPGQPPMQVTPPSSGTMPPGAPGSAGAPTPQPPQRLPPGAYLKLIQQLDPTAHPFTYSLPGQ